MNLLITVSGSGVSIGEVAGGQINCTAFVHENVPGNTLRKLLQKYWGGENTVVVEDREFGTGFHRVTTACSAGGHGWCYRLHQIVSEAEAIAFHDAMVAQAKAKQLTKKSGLQIAFERAAAAT